MRHFRRLSLFSNRRNDNMKTGQQDLDAQCIEGIVYLTADCIYDRDNFSV